MYFNAHDGARKSNARGLHGRIWRHWPVAPIDYNDFWEWRSFCWALVGVSKLQSNYDSSRQFNKHEGRTLVGGLRENYIAKLSRAELFQVWQWPEPRIDMLWNFFWRRPDHILLVREAKYSLLGSLGSGTCLQEKKQRRKTATLPPSCPVAPPWSQQEKIIA